MKVPDKKTFKTLDKDNKTELVLDVVKPSGKLYQEAQVIYAAAWQKAVNNKPPLILRAKVDKVLREQGLWDDDKDNEEKRLVKEIGEAQRRLKKGGMSVDDGRVLAIKIMKLRNEFMNLISQRNRIDANTAEAFADNSQFNFLVSQCTVYNTTGERFFASYEDYLERSDEQAARDAASKLMSLIYDIDDNAENQRPEIKFLKKMKLMDDQGRLTNEKGEFVDEDGNKVDKEGRRVNENGQLIDLDGNLINEKGQYIVEGTPFLDKDGNPIDFTFDEPEVKSESSLAENSSST